MQSHEMTQINRDLIISQSCQYGWAPPNIERAQEISSMLNELIRALENSTSVLNFESEPDNMQQALNKLAEK